MYWLVIGYNVQFAVAGTQTMSTVGGALCPSHHPNLLMYVYSDQHGSVVAAVLRWIQVNSSMGDAFKSWDS